MSAQISSNWVGQNALRSVTDLLILRNRTLCTTVPLILPSTEPYFLVARSYIINIIHLERERETFIILQDRPTRRNCDYLIFNYLFCLQSTANTKYVNLTYALPINSSSAIRILSINNFICVIYNLHSIVHFTIAFVSVWFIIINC